MVKKTAVLIIDMQRAYFNNEALREQQAKLVRGCNLLIESARPQVPVFMVTTVHQRDISTWTRNMIADKQGYLFHGTDDVQTLPDLNTTDTIPVVKTRDSAFFGTTLEGMLHNYDVGDLILAGVSTHTCIAQSAADAYAANFAVTIAVDAVAAHQPRFHHSTLDMLALEYRQKLSTVNEITSLMKTVP
jgi:nicotinamidase-related amidase